LRQEILGRNFLAIQQAMEGLEQYKLLIDLETTAAAVISMPVAFVRVASARPNGRANGHAGDELTH
jgi:precorrin isomerase